MCVLCVDSRLSAFINPVTNSILAGLLVVRNQQFRSNTGEILIPSCVDPVVLAWKFKLVTFNSTCNIVNVWFEISDSHAVSQD